MTDIKSTKLQAALFLLLTQTLSYLQHTMGPKSQLSEFKHVARSPSTWRACSAGIASAVFLFPL